MYSLVVLVTALVFSVLVERSRNADVKVSDRLDANGERVDEMDCSYWAGMMY